MTRPYRGVDLPGRRLEYLDGREGAPVVFVHAFPLTAAMWEPQLAALPRGWRGLAPDLRGFGRSRLAPAGESAGATSMDDHAADLLALLDALEIGSAVVVGLSMGGYVAFALYRRAPQRVRALVLADTRAEPDTNEGRARRDTMMRTVRDDGVEAIAKVMLPQLLAASTREGRPDLVRDVRAMVLQNSPEGVIDALACLKSRPDSQPVLPRLTCPTLIVVGDEDQMTPPSTAEAMACAIPNATVHVLSRAGHLSNLEQPEAFNRSLHGFLGRLAPP